MTSNPTVRLVVWINFFVLFAAVPVLLSLLVLPLGLVLVGRTCRDRWIVLLRRSKWLLAAIVVSYLLTTPGEYLIPGLLGTFEGAQAAGEQALRIALILLAVAWLLEAPVASLIAGIYGLSLMLLRPLGKVQLAERVAVRLALVLEAAEQPASDWRAILASNDFALGLNSRTATAIEIEQPVYRLRERLLLVSSMLSLPLLVFFGIQQ